MSRVHVRYLTAGLMSLLLTGCSTLGYYGQAVVGHVQLMYRSRPIPEVLADPGTPPGLRAQLERALGVRAFASQELALPDNGSYLSYADVGREAVVWSLVAAPEFSVEPRHWCYPVIGCAAYRGYFAREDAEAEARRLAGEGMEVAVNPVAAYSTLGWWDDPLPSPLLRRPEPQWAGVIFHELAHQRLYLRGDSAFNEAYATAVEQAGVRHWLARAGDPGGLAAWERHLKREREFVGLLLDARARLAGLYARGREPAALRGLKQAEFARLREDYATLKLGWGGYAGFDAWFARPLNNARLAAVATYQLWTPAFLALWEQQGGDFAAFHQAAEQLGALPAAERQRRLEALAPSPGDGRRGGDRAGG